MEQFVGTDQLRAPQQKRSRDSYDRVIEAAIELLKEGGLDAFTLAAVSSRSNVSIGSIYCRVDGKDALLREVQAVALQRMEQDFAVVVSRVRRKKLALRELVPAIVFDLANYLRLHASLLAAFMLQADRDPLVMEAGRKSYGHVVLDFNMLLLERKSEFGHADPEKATTTVFNVVFSTLARHLGFNSGASHGSAGEGNWQELVEDLGLMSMAFITLDLSKVRRDAAKTAQSTPIVTRRRAS